MPVTHCRPTIVLSQAGWVVLGLWGWLEAHAGLRAWGPGPEEQEERLGVSPQPSSTEGPRSFSGTEVCPTADHEHSSSPEQFSGWSLIGTLMLRA